VVTVTVNASENDPSREASSRTRAATWKQVAWFVVGVAIVVAIFVFVIPRFADWGEVWAAMKTLTPIEFWSLLAVTVFNLYTYWLANQAALPGLRIAQSAVVTQTGTAVANTVPAGGAVAIGMTYAILSSWGFTGSETALFVGVTGIWNNFAKLGLPVIALGLLVVTGHTNPALVSAAGIGIAVLVVAVVLLVLVFKSAVVARSVGEFIGRVASWFLRLVRKGPVQDMGDRAVEFRRTTIGLVRRRWIRLTWTTVLSQVALFLVLLVALRHMGVSEQELSAVEAFAVYTFARLLSAIPVTPGGVGVIDLGYIGGMTAIDRAESAQIIAAVLIFRVLTYGIQIPLGGITYFVWRAKARWRRDSPPPGSIATELAPTLDVGSSA
jgi:uncharacterized membrane protein YbhN (UPF0104 family)